MSPEYVRPYIKAQKNDDRDAEGIAEAASRPTMRFIDLKSREQLDIQTLHRVRSRHVAERRNLINQLRAILLERGIIFPVGRRKLELGVDSLLAEAVEVVSPRVYELVGDLRVEWKDLDTKIEALNTEFIQLARNDAAMRRLTSIPGIGVLNATAPWLRWEMQAASRKRAIWVPGSDWFPNSTVLAVNPDCLEYRNVETPIYALCSFMVLAQRSVTVTFNE